MASWGVNIGTLRSVLAGEEILEQRVAVLREDGLGVELHALDGQRAVAHAHDLAVLGPCGDLELRRAARALDGERMVARRLVRRRQALEDAAALVVDARDLAVHEGLRVDHLAAEGLADRLVAEAHTEDRDFPLEALEKRKADTRLVRRARAGRKHD